MKRLLCLFAILTAYNLLLTPCTGADTIYTKDNKEIKGIIVEEYGDRILISTVDGERSLMKSELRELYFDTEEQNLIKLAELARDRGDLIKAFVYYDKAFKVNPDSKAAKDGIVFLQGYLFKKDMAKKEQDINRRNEYEARGAGPAVIKTEEEKLAGDIEKLRKTAGIELQQDGTITLIKNVVGESPAYQAGMRKGDLLIAVWGRLVKYLSLQDVVELLLEKTSLETKCTIERSIDSGSRDLGADFKMLFDGMTISNIKEGSPAADAGFKTGDIIAQINGSLTRYMPLKKALELIKRSKGGTVRLTFRRDLVIWGKEGG